MDSDLIFDIGMHKGFDSEFYLKKGFRVVALEASADLCKETAFRCRKYVDSGKLKIVNKALYSRPNDTVSFFINPKKDDWGSLYKGAAEQHMLGVAVEIKVETVTLNELLSIHGVPYYIKCDIEGGDSIFAEQLVDQVDLPQYVSIEATKADDIANLRAAGYKNFQIINQYLNPHIVPPQPPREGKYVDTKFTHHTAGLFGKELPENGWLDFAQCIQMFLDWYSLRNRNVNLAVGWLDIHARLGG